jgi:hypothetical protein
MITPRPVNQSAICLGRSNQLNHSLALEMNLTTDRTEFTDLKFGRGFFISEVRVIRGAKL